MLNWCSLAFHRDKETHAPHGHCLHRTWVTGDLSGHQPAFLPAKLPRHKHAANTQIMRAGNPAERGAWEQEREKGASQVSAKARKREQNCLKRKGIDMIEQMTIEARENPTLKLQETPQSPRAGGGVEKMKDSVRDTGSEGVHFMPPHFKCLHSPLSLDLLKYDPSRKHITFLCSVFGMCAPELWSMHSSLPLMWWIQEGPCGCLPDKVRITGAHKTIEPRN